MFQIDLIFWCSASKNDLALNGTTTAQTNATEENRKRFHERERLKTRRAEKPRSRTNNSLVAFRLTAFGAQKSFKRDDWNHVMMIWHDFSLTARVEHSTSLFLFQTGFTIFRNSFDPGVSELGKLLSQQYVWETSFPRSILFSAISDFQYFLYSLYFAKDNMANLQRTWFNRFIAALTRWH